MPTLEIEISKQTLEQLDMQPGELAVAMKVMTALKMYELGQLTSYEAANLAEVSRGDFLQLLRTYQVPPFERLDTTGIAVRPVGELSDTDVLRFAHMRMPRWQSSRLDELLDQQREGQLTKEEEADLIDLLRLSDQAQLLKSEAMAEAVRRGLYEPGMTS